MARTMRRDVAEEMGDHALRQVVGLDNVVDRHLLQLGREPPMAADDAAHEALMGEMIEALCVPVALPGRVHEREAARGASSARNRSSSAIAISSANPIPTKPPVATVSPSWMSRTASAAVTTLPFSGERRNGRAGCFVPWGIAGTQYRPVRLEKPVTTNAAVVLMTVTAKMSRWESPG